MAIATYDSDLTSANGGQLAIASNAANWDESSDAGWDDAGTMVAETNFYIQGTECISAQFTKTGVGTIINIQGAAFTIDTDGAVLIWSFWASPSSLTTYATGGVRTVLGNTLGDFYAYKASGSDFEPNPFGGWYNYALDPAAATIDTTVGAPDDTWSHVGMAINATAQSRGNPHAVDAIRVGRCTLEVINGQAAAYGTFVGMASFDDSSGQRYALFQSIAGGYRWQGLISLGIAATAVDFRDSNANIVIANTPQVSTNFNKIEVHHVDSNVEWTSVVINAYGVNDAIAVTASAGSFEMIDAAALAWASCTFIDMLTFIFNKGTPAVTIDGTVFQRCGLITSGGASFDGCTIDQHTGAVGMTTSSPANAALITNTVFNSPGTGNGLEITGTAANFTLTGVDFTGYSSTVDANKAIFVNIATGTMTITISGGSGVTSGSPSVNVRSAGATVVVNSDVTVTFANLKDNSEVRIYTAGTSTQLAGIEDATAGSPDARTFAAAIAATTSVDYVIHNFQPGDVIYQTIRVNAFTWPSSDTTITVQQQIDRNAEN